MRYFYAWLLVCVVLQVAPAYAVQWTPPPNYEPTAVGTATQNTAAPPSDSGLDANGNPGTSRELGDVNMTPIIEGGVPDGVGSDSGSYNRGMQIDTRGSWSPGGPWGQNLPPMNWAMRLKYKTGALEAYVHSAPEYFADVWDRLKQKFPFNLFTSLQTMVQQKQGVGAGLELSWELEYMPDQSITLAVPAGVVTAIGWGRSIALWLFWLAAGWFLMKNFVGWFA